MSERIDFHGRYRPTALRSLTPGTNYVGLRCRNCGRHMAIMEDLAGAGAVEFGGPARFETECPHCGAHLHYAVDELQNFTAAQGGASSTA